MTENEKHLGLYTNQSEYKTKKGELTKPYVALTEDDGMVYYRGDIPPEGYVDLGLPSGLFWAKCNLGAQAETDYGKYFMWGETVGRTFYAQGRPCDWSHTPFNNGSNDYDEEYFASVSGDVCPNGILIDKYDAVYQATKGVAHMPTHEDFQELYDNTNNEWITDFNGSGVAGRKFTSKVDSSKYIFFPAAGYSGGESWFYVGSYGYVWSSSLYSSYPPIAFYLYFNSEGVYPSYDSSRYLGFSVRGVC